MTDSLANRGAALLGMQHALKLHIRLRSGKELVPGGLTAQSTWTVEELQEALHRARPKLYPSRQRLTLPLAAGQKKATALAPGKRLSDYGLEDNSQLGFKDLGPQIGYTTVFFWEYLGPLVTYALFYLFPRVFYPGYKDIPAKSPVQNMAVAYWTLHYTKRLLETFFVHKFSHGTMPLANLFKNCGYYWGFAAWVSYFVNHPLYTAPSRERAIVLLSFALYCQASNFWCHWTLARLRPAGQKGYVIPKGYGFDYVTCANYMFEVWGWVAFSIATQTLTAAFFTAAGTLQMMIWAKAKHVRLCKLFDGKEGREKYPRRWVMLPPAF